VEHRPQRTGGTGGVEQLPGVRARSVHNQGAPPETTGGGDALADAADLAVRDRDQDDRAAPGSRRGVRRRLAGPDEPRAGSGRAPRAPRDGDDAVPPPRQQPPERAADPSRADDRDRLSPHAAGFSGAGPHPSRNSRRSAKMRLMGVADSGEMRAWDLLAAGSPGLVCARSGSAFDAAAGDYRLASFGQGFMVRPGERRIDALAPAGEAMLRRHGDLLRLSLLWYLVKATGDSPSGALVNPARLPGGDLFARGTHVLPLDALAAGYSTRPEDFLAAGTALGGRPAPYGDAAVQLPALPKVPVTLLLWRADDEFPARAVLLFDATAPRHLPTDVLWAVAMLSVQLMQHPAVGRP
jgi:hypothetical protein